MNILKVTGYYGFRDPTPEATMADMLRYDDGEMIGYRDLPGSAFRASKLFEAEVHTNSFTPERWRSFGLRATLVRKEPGKAQCSFPNMNSVSKFIQEQRTVVAKHSLIAAERKMAGPPTWQQESDFASKAWSLMNSEERAKALGGITTGYGRDADWQSLTDKDRGIVTKYLQDNR